MSWSDDFYKMNSALQTAAIESVETVIYQYSTKVFTKLQDTTPVATGGLKNSLTMKPYSGKKSSKVGYTVKYDGYDEKGRPYQLIANSINRGYLAPDGTIRDGTHFMDISVTQLSGMDKAINEEWQRRVNEEMKK